MVRPTLSLAVALILALALLPSTAAAQITTGTVTGRVVDTQGGVIPGATVVLISETRGTRSAPVVTNETGDYVSPNVTADTYTVEVSLASFKTVLRRGIIVTGGERVGVERLTLEPGVISETITVVADSPLVQTQSGERSFTITGQQIENLPVLRNFTSVVAFVPGVNGGDTTSAGGTRLGGASQNNIMMDGISAMDTGNNGQMLQMNIESIGEVKILTQGYQAEYGRSSGLQITAVTKSGTNQFRGSGYGVFTNSDWTEKTWVRQKNNDPTPKTKQDIYGYSVGGPVGKPGGQNKLFFFYAHEYRPTTVAINDGNVIRYRVPTAAERAGDFSQTRDKNGNPLTSLIDHTTGQSFAGKTDPGQPAVWPRPGGAQPLPAPERGATDGDELQLRGPCADVQTADPAAGRPRRLPDYAEAAAHGQVLGAAATTGGDAGLHPGLLGCLRAQSLYHQLRLHRQLRDLPDDVPRGRRTGRSRTSWRAATKTASSSTRSPTA